MSREDIRRKQPGSRLAPDEYTPHVPIHIDGTEDFELQGWPWEQTEENPYMISGLNITRELGVVLIEIKNTYAHFLIQDCYVRQLSSVPAAVIENTTHASLEYNS